MAGNVNVFLTAGTTVTCHDGPDVPYLVIDPEGDYRATVALFLGHGANPNQRLIAAAQLDALERAIRQARRLLEVRQELVGEPDDDEDDDVDAGAVPAWPALELVAPAARTDAYESALTPWPSGQHHPLPGYHADPVQTCPTCHPAAYREAVAQAQANAAVVMADLDARLAADDPLGEVQPFRQAHPMTEAELAGWWGRG